ncbi:hypothetical protein B0H14DRAFT_2625494 [Mycena olivaceomarginata]|nr:hypothetical protein B0H14DRAFT_2625494 [Mycena olivaceomarginata]
MAPSIFVVLCAVFKNQYPQDFTVDILSERSIREGISTSRLAILKASMPSKYRKTKVVPSISPLEFSRRGTDREGTPKINSAWILFLLCVFGVLILENGKEIALPAQSCRPIGKEFVQPDSVNVAGGRINAVQSSGLDEMKDDTQGGSSGCDENSENLNVTDGSIEVDVQSYQRQEFQRGGVLYWISALQPQVTPSTAL